MRLVPASFNRLRRCLPLAMFLVFSASAAAQIIEDVVATPALSISDVTQSEGQAGVTTFTFTVSLSAPAAAGGVTFDIATADGTATTSGSDYAAKSSTGQTIAAGQSTYTFGVDVNGDTNIESDKTFFVNVTSVVGATVEDGQGLGTITNDDTVDLSVAITDSPDPINVGNNLTYTIQVANNGSNAASSVLLEFTLPSGTSFVALSSPAGWSATTPAVGASGTISASQASLNPGSDSSFELVVDVDESLEAGEVTATATISGSEEDANEADNSATETTAVTRTADLSIAIAVEGGPAAAGANGTFVATVTNAGPDAANDVAVLVRMSGPLAIVSTAASQGTGTIDANDALFSVETLPSGGSATFTVTAAMDASASTGLGVQAWGVVLSHALDPNPDNSSVTLQSIVGPALEPSLATPLSDVAVGARVSENLYPAGDADVYSFSGHAGDRVFIATTTTASSDATNASRDTLIRVVASDGATVLEIDDDDGGMSSTSSSIAGLALPADGTYYIVVECQRPEAIVFPYELYVRLQSGTPSVETVESEIGQALTGARWIAGETTAPDEDIYTLRLNAGDTVFVSLDLDPERDGTGWDGYLALSDAEGPASLVGSFINGSDLVSDTPPSSEALIFTAKEAGDYTIDVGSRDGYGNYQLSVGVLPARAENTATTYTATVSSGVIPIAGELVSTFTIPDSKRIGKLKVALNITTLALPDFEIHLRGPGGNTVGLVRRLPFSLSDKIDLILDDDGAYAVGFNREEFLVLSEMGHLDGAILKPDRHSRLGWFAGQDAAGEWQLTIRNRSGIPVTATLNSWSLIVVDADALPSDAPTGHFTADFENDDGGFTSGGTNNEWAHGAPNGRVIDSANSGTNAWVTDLAGTYEASSNQTLTSPEIDLIAVGTQDLVYLSWAMKYQLGDASTTTAYVEVEEVGGNNQSEVVWQWLGPVMQDENVGASNQTIDKSAGWGLHRALISGFAGKTVRLKFHLKTNGAPLLDGWAIDDVAVTSYDRTAPAVSSVVRHNGAGAGTAANTLVYRVQFTESVEGVGLGNFALAAVTGNVSGTIASVVGSGSVYYVTVTGVTGAGSLRLDVNVDGITDPSGNALAGGFAAGQTYTRIASARAYAWGNNNYGQLGSGTTSASPNPAFVKHDGSSALAGKTVAALAAGGEHTLALDSAGRVYAWGRNEFGEIGNGSDDQSIFAPVAVSPNGALANKTIVAIAAGYGHSLALDSAGKVYSWGWNNYGQLGIGSDAELDSTPTQIAGLLADKVIVAISAGRHHSLALAADGTLYSWGSAQESQLGNGTSGAEQSSRVPVAVTMNGALVGKTIVGISAGMYHNLVVASDGTAYGWGGNSMGELGNGGHVAASEPVAVNVGSSSALQGKTVVAVAAGSDHSLALDSDGKVYAWGFNIAGQLGTGNGAGPHSSPLIASLPNGAIATAIYAGSSHSFALTSENVLYAWGSNYSGKLGTGTWDESELPVPVDTSAASALQGATVLALSSGSGFADHSLVIGSTPRPVVETITTPHGAYNTGSMLVFELTVDRAVIVDTTSGTPRLVLFLDDGEVYADYVATSDDGKTLQFAYTVTGGDIGSFGIGLQSYLDLNGGSIVDAADESLALTPAFPATDLEGVIVDGIAPTIRSIVRAGGAAQATGLTTLAFNVVVSEAITSDGDELSAEDFSLVGVEGNVSGRISDVRLVIGGGDGRPRRMAALAKGGPSAAVYRVTIDDLAGAGEFSLALSSSRPIADLAGNPLTGSATSQSYTRFENASAFAWGKGDDGQLGNGNSDTRNAPNAVHADDALANKTIVAIANGANHTLALTSDGQVFGWGANFDGQLAIEEDASDEPVVISPAGALNGKFIVAIAAGRSFSVALTSEGEVITWGRNEDGELGIDSDDEFNAVPTLVELEGDFDVMRIAAIAAGAHHVLALTENGGVYAWGSNDVGQLGNEETSDSERSPVFAYIYEPVAAISAGANHSLALTFEGDVLSWGGNESGQLGDGTEDDREWAESVQFPGLEAGEEPADAIASIAAGDRYSLALTADGRLFAWGANGKGQLGLGTDNDVSAPARVNIWGDVRLATLFPAREVVLAFDTAGAAYGWGDNTNGQLASEDDEVFNRPLLLPLEAMAKVFVLGSGVSADHSTLLGVAAALAAPDLIAENDTGASDSDNITKATTLTFNGVAPRGFTVALFDGETEIGSGVASMHDGSWTVTIAALEDGVHQIAAALPSLDVVSELLSVTVDSTAPVITSGGSATGTFNAAFAGYTIAATDTNTLTYAGTGLPAGLELDAGSGAITGTPTAVGATTVAVAAIDMAGNTASKDVNFTIQRAAAVVQLSALSATYNGAPKSVVATTTPSGLPVTIIYGDNAAPPSNAGSYPVTATIETANYIGSATGTLVIDKADQTVSFADPGSPAPNQPVTLAATSSAGLEVTFSVQSGSAAVDGTTLTIQAAGSVVIRATASSDSNYNGAFAERTIVSSRRSQTITFAVVEDKLTSDEPFALIANASSGLPVTLTIVSGPAQLSDSMVTLTGGAGVVSIRASQEGNATYEAAVDVVRSFDVSPAGDLVFFGDFFANTATPDSANTSKGRVRAMAVGDPKVGEIAAVLPANSSTGSLLIVAPSIGINGLVTFTLENNGSFTTTIDQAGATPRTLTVHGQLTGATLSGTIEGTGYSFSTDVEPPSGPSADAAGLYRSSSLETAQGTTYTVIGTNNNVLVLTITPDFTLGGMATLEEDGTFELELTAQDGATVTVQGTVDTPTNSVAGKILVPNQAPVDFAGLETTVTRTDRLIGLSSRGHVGTGDNILISGLVIGGSQPKEVLIRAIGPALAQFDVANVLVDPRIVLFRGPTPIAENDNWATNDNADEVAAAAQRVGLVGLPNDSKDALLLKTLEPGAYTVHIHGGNGVALAEVYDASENPGAETQRLVDIATRGRVGTGDNVLIGGLVITGNAPKRVLIRGVGPGLVAQGVAGALVDPKIIIYRGGTVIAENNDWSSDASAAAQVAAAETAAGAFHLQNGSKDAAVVLTLAPGPYTVHVAGVNNTTGVALVEIYEVAE